MKIFFCFRMYTMKSIFLTCLISILMFSNAVGKGKLSRFFNHYPPPPTGPARRSEINEFYITQKLDHFDENVEKTWLQRYFVNSEFYNNATRNVAFLMLGGESEAAETWMVYGSWIVSAKKYGALLFQLEHRYYGKSQPLDDLSTEHLRYLSSEQALADAANFVKGMNEKYSLGPDVRWIVFGGSYAGSLAAWMRLKYPDLVHGVMSGCGPLTAQLDFPEYFQVVIDDLASVSEQCLHSLKTGMAQVDALITEPNGNESVTNIFNLCEPIEGKDMDDYSVANFYNSLAISMAYVAQYNGALDYTINDLCAILTDVSKGKEILRIAEIIRVVYGTSCVNCNYSDEVAYMKNVTIGLKEFYRQWVYQTCTEYGWFQTSNREDNILGRGCSVDYYANRCSDVFGPEFNETFINDQINRTNSYYGGIGINASNVVYVYGSMDPWHPLGLLEGNNPESPVIFIEGTSHCSNMYDYEEGELPQLTAARDEVDRLIGVWLGFK